MTFPLDQILSGNLRGAQGIQGIQGPAGSGTGDGSQGTQGIQGKQGTQGTQGLQGIQGTQGLQGLQGIQGTQGLQGLQGIQGTQGLQGIQGTQGLQGIQGTQGLQGLQGLQGTQGLQGLQGLQGIQGTQGLQGLQGIQGTQGITGSGSQGAQGTAGSIGAVGSDKQILFNDAGIITGSENLTFDKTLKNLYVGPEGSVALTSFYDGATETYYGAGAFIVDDSQNSGWRTIVDATGVYIDDGAGTYAPIPLPYGFSTPAALVFGTVSASTLLNIYAGASLQFNSTNGGIRTVGITNPTAFASSYTLTLPTSAGSNGQVLKTDGTGVLSWTSSVDFTTLSASTTTTSGAVNVTYNPTSASGAAIQTSGKATQGGSTYFDFLKITNTVSGATNASKYFRIDNTGKVEIINSAYTSSLWSITDAGVMSTGQIQISGKKAVNGPAFRAYISTGQTITSGSQQKITFGSETFDTDSCFSSSRFTPTTEGYYQFNATVRIAGSSGTGEVMIVLYKNGSEYARGTNEGGTEQGANWYSMQVSDIAYANGSTDYFEIYLQQTSGSSHDTTAGSAISYFSGVMVRGG